MNTRNFRQSLILYIAALITLTGGCMQLLGQTISLEDIQSHIDNYYENHPDWSAKKAAVEKGSAIVSMTLTEVGLATSVRKLKEAKYPLAQFYFNPSGCWYGDTTMTAGGLLSWTVNRPKSLSYPAFGAVEVPEYTYYFKWNDDMKEYICYDWIMW